MIDLIYTAPSLTHTIFDAEYFVNRCHFADFLNSLILLWVCDCTRIIVELEKR